MSEIDIKKELPNWLYESGFLSLFETALGIAPFVGRAILNRKFNIAERRIKEHTKKISAIEKSISTTKFSKEYYEERIGSMFIEDFLNEHEDAKIIYLLNGYHNVFIEENYSESIVYQYFDTLRILRYADIRRLLFHYNLDSIYPNDAQLTQSEVLAFTQGIDIKLEKYGLTNVPITFGNDGTNKRYPEEKQDSTDYGHAFVKFIMENNYE